VKLAPIAKSADQVVGRRELRVLDELLAELHGTHPHPNRTLHYDHVVVAHLLAFFNPALRGLRSIQELFNDARVRRRFGTPRVPKSTLADAQRLFDPQLLMPLIETLQRRLAPPTPAAPLDQVTRQLLAVDGSFFAVAPRIAWALYNQNAGPRPVRKGNVRLHTHFDVRRGIPTRVGLTDGHYSESQHLRARLEPDSFYLLDRGFQAYALLGSILEIGSDFVVRLRKSVHGNVLETNALTPADQAAGVVADEWLELGWRRKEVAALPRLRRVVIQSVDRTGQANVVLLLTNRGDLPAHVVAMLYRHRWQVELFFRWLKCVAHFEHFFSESPAGMTLQVYVAIIGTLLIALQIGARPTKYDYALMTSTMLGWTTIDHVVAMALQRRQAAERAAARAAARRAAQKTKA